jgi:hypothetical protein
MKRPKKKSKRPVHVLRLWTLEQARTALPYLRSLTSSLREHWLEANRYRVESRRLKSRSGRPDRHALIAHEEAMQGVCRAADAFQEALEELQNLDIFLLDPVQGIALVPFKQADELAWFVFELFSESKDLEGWRFHRDTLQTRRPLAEATSQPPAQESTAA